MATPPVPPRPYDAYDSQYQRQQRQATLPPPIPPLPSDFNRSRIENDYPVLNPHLAEPLVAPRPTRLLNDVPSNMAQRLDDQMGFASPPPPQQQQSQFPSYPNQYQAPAAPQYPTGGPGGFRAPDLYNRGPSPYPGAPPPLPPNATPGFAQPPRVLPQPQQPQQPQQSWTSPNPQPTFASPPPIINQPTYNQPAQSNGYQRTSVAGITQDLQSLTFSSPPPPQQQNPQQRPPFPHSQTVPSAVPTYQGPSDSNRRRSTTVPSLTAIFPTVKSLTEARGVNDPAGQIAWAKDVLWLVEKSQMLGTTTPPSGPLRISDSQLQSLADQAINMILRMAPSPPLQNPSPYIVEAVFLRGKLSSSGWFPDLVPRNPREAFRYFEASARAGYSAAWFYLGRDYEGVGDAKRAADCFERGVKAGSEHCLYRMGMVHLMGQLSFPADPAKALQLLRAAADSATMDMPQPAYVYGLLLLGEFSAVTVPQHMFNSLLPGGTSAATEARRHIERAAFLGFSPAQYKLGHCYEYATHPFPFDPLLSVQYYSLASQQGEVEADMALSKWFLCGAEGVFDKDENLAYTFAEKAARKNLGTAQFAMGYYAEVGVGRAKDLEVARKWYTMAADQGNTDAVERLQALSHPTPQALSRQHHETITDAKLVRQRTQARKESVAQGQGANYADAEIDHVVNHVKKLHKLHPPSSGSPPRLAGSLPNSSPPQSRPGTSSGQTGTSPPLGGRGGGFARPPRQETGAGGGRGRGAAIIAEEKRQSSYSLSDNQFNRPPTSLQDPGPVQSSGSSTNSSNAGSQPNTPGPRPGGRPPPATFQEMGIAVGKVDDKDCVIM